MASNDQSLLPNHAEPNKPFIIISLSHILKLTPTNYISWKTQLEATLLGHDLHKFIDGSHPAPSKNITQNDTITTNPAYTTWFRQDKLILGALAGTLSSPLVPLISQCLTTHDAWQTLAKTYANPSKGHLKQIKDHLRNITKGTRSISDYMQEIKRCTDQLASLGRSLDPEDIVDKVLDQLNDPDYDSVINAVQSRETPITFDELHEKLINRELSLKHKTNPSTTFPATVNYAAKHQNRNYQPRPPSSNASLLPTPNQSNYPPPNRSSQPFKGWCQWCQNPGHYVSQCPIFRSQYPTAILPSNPHVVPPYAPPRPITKGYQSSFPRAYAATATNSSSNGWLLDSGATHHVTHDLDNLALHSPYDGTGELIIGDGSGLAISNTGSPHGGTSSSRPN